MTDTPKRMSEAELGRWRRLAEVLEGGVVSIPRAEFLRILAELTAARSDAAGARAANDESAWWIELGSSEPSAPSYWGWDDDASGTSDDGPGFDWVKDHQAALRFGRKIDAERYAQDAGWNNVRICEHGWYGPCVGEHEWFKPDFIAYECCKFCGIVKRADGKNKPCKGVVRVGPRPKTDGA